MICPECNSTTTVFDSRQKGTRKWRRHKCSNGHRFTTWEPQEAELATLYGTVPKEQITHVVTLCLPEFIEAISSRLNAHE